MNSLSFLLYIIYLFGALKVTISIGIAIFSIATAVSAIGYMVCKVDDFEDKWSTFWYKVFKRVASTLTALMFLMVVIPSSSTLKLIAASEVAGFLIQTEAGQTVVQELSQTAGKTGEITQDALNLLHQYIKNELNSLQSAEKSATFNK